MTEADLALAAECERRIVNAWPAPATLIVGDFVARFAGGYSGRANSLTPLRLGAELDDEGFAFVEELYRGDGLPPAIRLTPLLGEATRERALARGYVLKDASFGMVAELAGAEIDPDITIDAKVGEAWIAGVAGAQTGVKADAGLLAAIVEKVRLPAAFATLYEGGEPVAHGMSVAERGMAEIGSVVVAPEHRGRGLGRRIVMGLMGWAQAMECAQAYLQVEQGNAAALGLYGKLGFRQLYAYETRWLPLE